MRRILTIAICCVTCAAAAQQVGENAPQRSGDLPVFSSTSQMVVEAVSVTDKSGKPILGLTAKDFAVTENGAPQAIKVFEYQNVNSEPLPALNNFDKVKVYEKLSRSQIAAEAAGETRYRDRRLLALYFDMTSMPAADQLRALEAAQKFLQTQMTAADLVAILRYEGGAVEVLQDFTADRERLLSIISTIAVGEGQGYGESSEGGTPDVGAAFGQDDSEFNIFNTDRQLSALQTAAQMLGRLSE
jgi:VWFA-related protein